MESNTSFMPPYELELRLNSASPSSDHRRQKMTIFYDDRVIASDLTASQARAIIDLAKEVGELQEGFRGEDSFPVAAAAATQLMNPGQSMKRSLQRFLQKRKARIADLPCPYQHALISVDQKINIESTIQQ